jgi:hypothetical protein
VEAERQWNAYAAGRFPASKTLAGRNP